MNVNMSSDVYSYVKNTAGDVSKSSGSQPAVESSSMENTSLKSGLSSISGQGLMMSRLFGNADTVPPVQTQLTKTMQNMDAANFLTQDDRSMLSGLYSQAQEQGTDLRYVDDLARDLGGYRKFGDVSGNYNSGNTYDMSGRKQTIEFTAKDSETAASEVTFKAEEPDVISKDGVFTITETGKKHGFRLEGNSVVQDKGHELDRLKSQSAITLMDYFSNNKKDEMSSEKPTTLFDYLFSSKSGN